MPSSIIAVVDTVRGKGIMRKKEMNQRVLHIKRECLCCKSECKNVVVFTRATDQA